LGRVEKGEKCSVEGCANTAIRSLSMNTVRGSGLKLRDTKRAYLCHDHYREFKKLSKADRKIDTLRWRSTASKAASYHPKGAGIE
jgi:hypothetical protein